MNSGASDRAAACRAALDCLGHSAGPLAIDGIPASRLADEFGTPLYAYSAATLDRRVAAVRAALGPRVELLYSIKSNPSLAITAKLHERGVGAEIASLGELHLALAAGLDPAGLRFAGPGKSDAELDAAIAVGLGCFHVEAASEVQAIADAARRHGVRAGVAVRVNLPGELGGSRMRMGGVQSRFGVDAAGVPELLATIAKDRTLDLRGLHVYAGTQCFDAEAFVQHARTLVEHATRWERELDLRLDELDLGGGFGVPVYTGDPEFDLDAAGRGVRDLIAEYDRPGRVWLVELGRYLVAPAGVYLARVLRAKTSGGQRFVSLDGGMNHCAVATGAGAVLRRTPLIVQATDPFAAGGSDVTIGGPLCTPADEFAAGTAMPALTEGDLLAILGTGAYGLTYSPTGFLSHPTPGEVMVEDGAARVIRNRGQADDVLRGQRR